MKILVPVIHWSVSSEAAYQISDIAHSLGADIYVLFIVPAMGANSYVKGDLAIEIFEEAVQHYNVDVDGDVVAGDTCEVVLNFASKERVDLILLGSDGEEEDDWRRFSQELIPLAACEVQHLDDVLQIDTSIAADG